jgi:hypothetical protein
MAGSLLACYLPDCCIDSRPWGSSVESLEDTEETQQLLFQLFVGIHGQDQFAGRTNNAPSALNESPAQS